MGIANQILNLRENHDSSVAALLAALDQVRCAPDSKQISRRFYVGAAVELVLTNVAAHAAEALSEPAPIHKASRVPSSSHRHKRRFDSSAPSRQRILFALH